MVLNFALSFSFFFKFDKTQLLYSLIKLVVIAVTVLFPSMCREMMHLSYEVFLMYEIWMLIKNTFYILHIRLRLIDYDYYISFIKLLFTTSINQILTVWSIQRFYDTALTSNQSEFSLSTALSQSERTKRKPRPRGKCCARALAEWMRAERAHTISSE